MSEFTNLPQPPAEDPSYDRAASYIAQALTEIERSANARAASHQAELDSGRARLMELTERLEQQLEEEKAQRAVLADQLTNLAGSLDRLGSHLQGLSQLLADLLQRLAEPVAATLAPSFAAEPAQPVEPVVPTFPPGGEGVSLSLVGVPGFQALMDLQKALIALDQVEGASVERFQEGDSRILLHLSGPLTASELAQDLRAATGHNIVVEESRPELLRLRLKIVNGETTI